MSTPEELELIAQEQHEADKEFDHEEGELTRTRKLRRTFVAERYRELVHAIYGDQTEVPIEAQIRYRDGRMGTIKTTISIKSFEGVDE